LPGTIRHDPTNPAYLHPAEFPSLGIDHGDKVEIASDLGKIIAVAQPDETIRRGVVSIAHNWGGLPGKDGRGVNTNLLIATDRHVASVNAMPRMSGVPVNLRKAGA
jgi:anaerobic selenocysteine-containing dehydrogenase